MSISNLEFIAEQHEGYTFKGPSIILGGPILDGATEPNLFVRIPLKTLNRHGLIAGATGTGKTKTLQIIAEQLAQNGVSSLVMDVKGDLSGIAAEGTSNKKIVERHEKLGLPFTPHACTVEMLSLSDEPGVRLRATVTEFGPVLFSKMLNLNENQESVVALVFKYCDDHGLPLLDLKDFRSTMVYLSNEGKKEIEREYGRISSASVGAIIRKIVALEQQGATRFFGEPSFDVFDLEHITREGEGTVSILRLSDIQDKPMLFSTFMLQLLAELYNVYPEVGDVDQPNLMLFIDEAHLIFENASDALLGQMETIVKLIRSKGIGLVFITQNPTDIPDSILSQLGLKVQHALRAFTAKDRKAIKQASENFPLSKYYEIDQVITEMGIGEALITALNEKGIPTPLAYTLLRAPESRMDVLSQSEIDDIVKHSSLVDKYARDMDPESAYEILNKRMEAYQAQENQEEMRKQQEVYKKTRRGSEKSSFEKVFESTTTRQIGRTVAREITRGLLGMLGIRRR